MVAVAWDKTIQKSIDMEKIVIKKSELLKAMKQILQEYIDKVHETSIDTCALCLLYNKKNVDEDYLPYTSVIKNDVCEFCPMYVFKPDFHSLQPVFTYACMNRYCVPLNENEIKNRDTLSMLEINIQLQAVIEFYTRAIKHISHKTNKELNEENAFAFLKSIDEDINTNLIEPFYLKHPDISPPITCKYYMKRK